MDLCHSLTFQDFSKLFKTFQGMVKSCMQWIRVTQPLFNLSRRCSWRYSPLHFVDMQLCFGLEIERFRLEGVQLCFFSTYLQTLKVQTDDLDEIRLTYFPVRGRAEIARLILVQAGVAYQDIRIKREDFLKVKYCPKSLKVEKWHTPQKKFQVKPILPYGSLPILEYKGEVRSSQDLVFLFGCWYSIVQL